jgi:hypothetical protein
MTRTAGDSQGQARATPSRSHSTPAGYRNVRVIVPQDLHWKLMGFASESHMTLPEFVISWLERVTPLTPAVGPSSQRTKPDAPPTHVQG